MSLNNSLFGVVGAGFLTVGLMRFAPLSAALCYTLFAWILLFFLLCDLRTLRIPPRIALVALCVGFLFGTPVFESTRTERALGALAAYLLLWCVLIVSTWALRHLGTLSLDQFAMGAGDPLVFACIAAFVGPQPLSALLYFASLQALCFYLIGSLIGPKRPLFCAVPFGTFLALSALELSLFPDLPAQIHGIFRSII